jgi:hypothetical protein
MTDAIGTRGGLAALCGRLHGVWATRSRSWPNDASGARRAGTVWLVTNAVEDAQYERDAADEREEASPLAREKRVALLLVRADGRVEQSDKLADKRRLAETYGSDDRLLAVWMQRFHPVVLWVGDLDSHRVALGDR